MSLNRLDKFVNTVDSDQEHTHLSWKPIIISDSKGRYLKPYDTPSSQILWENQGGRSSEQAKHWLSRNIDQLVRQHNKIHLFIWVGTCDLTLKSGRYISLKEDQTNAVQKLKGNLTSIKTITDGKQNAKVTFLHIPYYSILHHNKLKGDNEADRLAEKDIILKSSIDKVNNTIDLLNSEVDARSPKFNEDLVKRRKSKKGKTRFSTNFTLFKDGLHPSEMLAKTWLKSIQKIINKDCI